MISIVAATEKDLNTAWSILIEAAERENQKGLRFGAMVKLKSARKSADGVPEEREMKPLSAPVRQI